ncbi:MULTISPECIES: GNAT family N-acetyltransferase [unclassified Cytobacillus]|uniref:GNAT family N-acetyltransferase n=1 Tax=unclassified Cytobacillus TaxID=2675268 RepID=UPI001357C528|nr:GNAT family N-acetyltransferase [Cytobacillus sp. AMY 15.2]KAF0821059.1 acetyltransferase, GNAT family [Bacillus sp. ZZV12-4809]MCM3091012.1 GNAT family N-acetyltransferase [Cytobacillus sp. AMY 15.2]
MEIYQASMEDLAGVSALFNLYRVFYSQASDLEAAAGYIRERLEKEDSVIFVVREEGKYLGFTQLYPTFSSVSMKKAWILNDLYVDAAARKGGIGEKLIDKAKELAAETGAVSISLSTASDNFTAQRLYEKMGFKRDEQFYHYELVIG